MQRFSNIAETWKKAEAARDSQALQKTRSHSLPRIRQGGAFLKNTGKRAFADAAEQSSMTSGWSAFPTTADAYIYQFWYALVARSRDQAEKSDHGRKFLQLCVDNIAGPKGFSLMANVLDPNGTRDELASSAIEASWETFGRKKNFTTAKTLSKKALERLMVRTVAKDGEFFAIKQRGSKYKHGIALQIIDPVMCDPTYFKKCDNGNNIRHGIEFDEDGAPVAYYFRRQTEMQAGYIVGTGYSYQRYLAEDVIHVFVCEIVGQKRGLPWMRTALLRMRHLAGFDDAVIVNARIAAAKMGFFRDTDGDVDDNEDLPMDAEPGTFENIGNREFVPWNPEFPSESIEPFSKTCLRSVASGLCVSYNNLASDLTSVNFSSIRQGALDEREVWKAFQEFFIENFCEELYPDWLEMALMKQEIFVFSKGGNKKALPFEKMEKFLQVAFRGRRWTWIDPKTDVEANALAVSQGFKSVSDVIREMGNDPEDVWAEKSADKKEMARLDITPEPMPGMSNKNLDKPKDKKEPVSNE